MAGSFEVTRVIKQVSQISVVSATVVSGHISSGDTVSLVREAGARLTGRVVQIRQGQIKLQKLVAGQSASLVIRRAHRTKIRPSMMFSVLQPEQPDAPGGDARTEPPVITRADAKAPALLLPLRVETAFAGTGLRIRAYPDHWHIDSFQDVVSRSEAKDYAAYVAAGASENAFATLVAHVGLIRAHALVTLGQAGPLQVEGPGLAQKRPHAALLPSRLGACVRLHDGSELWASGEKVSPNIFVGPAASDTSLTQGSDAPMGWAADFDKAQKIGLAMELALDRSQVEVGIKDITVVGMHDAPHTLGASRFHAHAQRLAGSLGLKQLYAGQFTKGENAGKPLPDGETMPSQRKHLSEDLGVDLPLQGTAPDTSPLTHAAFVLLWEAALRPFAVQTLRLLSPEAALQDAAHGLAELREDIARLIAPAGQYPLIAVGDVPYGILPVDSTVSETKNAWLDHISRPLDDAAEILSETAQQLRAKVRALPAGDARIASLMRTPSGHFWRVRGGGVLDDMLDGMLRLSQSNPQDPATRAFFSAIAARIRGIAAKRTAFDIQTTWQTKAQPDGLADIIFLPFAQRLCGPLVAAGGEDRYNTDAVQDSDIERLLEDPDYWPSLTEHIRTRDPGDKPSIFALLAEIALLHCISEAQAGMTEAEPSVIQALLTTAPTRRDEDGTTVTARHRLAIENASQHGAIGDGMNALVASSLSHRVEDLSRVIKAVLLLNDAPRGAAHAALAGVIDAVSYRADIWLGLQAQTSIRHYRDRDASGLCIGAWGRIEGLSRGDGHEQASEYLVAPSQRLARTAGLLHRAEQGMNAAGFGANPASKKAAVFDANISLPRLQAARKLLWCLSHGVPLQDGLSRLTARVLRDAGKAELFDKLAARYPSIDEAPDGGARSSAASGSQALSLDAFVMLSALRAGDIAPEDGGALLTDVEAALDGLSALMLAEGAAALAEGRVDAAKAVLSTHSAGGAPADIPSVIEPRVSGISLSFGVALCGQAEPSSQLPDRLSPALANIASHLLGPVNGQFALVDLEDGQALPTNVPASQRHKLANLATPLGMVLLSEPGMDTRDALMHMARDHVGAPTDSDGDGKSISQGLWLDTDAEDTLWAASRIFELLAASRTMNSEDLGAGQGGDAGDPARDIDNIQLTADVAAARGVWERLATDLGAYLEEVRQALETADALVPEILRPLPNMPNIPLPPGFPGIPSPPPDSINIPGLGAVSKPASLIRDLRRLGLLRGADTSLAVLSTLFADIQKRLQQVNLETSQQDSLDQLTGPLRAPIPLAGNSIGPWRTEQQLRGAEDIGAWLEVSATVRERLRPLADLCVGRTDERIHIAQWPEPNAEDDADIFIGGPRPEAANYAATNAVITFGANPNDSSTIYALVVDRWDETVPERETTAGLIVSTSVPGARAPNALLFAPPPDGQAWDADALVDTVDTAMDIARMRTLGPVDFPSQHAPRPGGGVVGEVFGDLGQLLPMTVFSDEGLRLLRARCEQGNEPDVQ